MRATLPRSRRAPTRPRSSSAADLRGYGWCIRKQNYVNVGLGRLDGHALAAATAAVPVVSGGAGQGALRRVVALARTRVSRPRVAAPARRRRRGRAGGRCGRTGVPAERRGHPRGRRIGVCWRQPRFSPRGACTPAIGSRATTRSWARASRVVPPGPRGRVASRPGSARRWGARCSGSRCSCDASCSIAGSCTRTSRPWRPDADWPSAAHLLG